MKSLEQEFSEFVQKPGDDRAPLFHRLQHEAPAFQTPDGIRHLTRYEDVDLVAREVLAKLTRESKNSVSYVVSDNPGPAQRMMSRVMGWGSQEDHVRLRRLVSKAFTPRAVASMQEEIDAIAHRLASRLVAKGGGDLVTDFTLPFPIEVIASMFGMRAEHHERLRGIGVSILGMLQIHPPQEAIDYADREAQLFRDMVLELVEERRSKPGDDLLSHLIAAEEEGDRLTIDELVSTCFVLTAAGHETTASVVASLVFHLLSDRSRWDELRADHSLIPGAVEEGLRFEPPLQAANLWWPKTDLSVAGVDIVAGEKVTLWFAAANRDATVFEDPDTFDIHRQKNPHLTFSAGPHYCLGANLARREAIAAVRELLVQAPELRLTSNEASWAPLARHRSLTTLPVSCV